MARGGWRHLPAALMALVFLLPLFFMLTGSLRKAGLPPPTTPELGPGPLAFDNYPRAFDKVDIPGTRQLAYVVAVAVPLTVLVASWAGFAMTRVSRRASAWLIAASLVALMVPITALLVPRFVMFKYLGMIDTYWPLIAPR